jgi:hypothetical protein
MGHKAKNLSPEETSLEKLSVWQIPVFRYGLLMRNRGYIEFETLEKQRWSYLWNIKTALNCLFTNVSHIIYPYFY